MNPLYLEVFGGAEAEEPPPTVRVHQVAWCYASVWEGGLGLCDDVVHHEGEGVGVVLEELPRRVTERDATHCVRHRLTSILTQHNKAEGCEERYIRMKQASVSLPTEGLQRCLLFHFSCPQKACRCV
jgi:hypothetical protein